MQRWWHNPRTLIRIILQLDDSPHAIALGTAIGMFIAMTPTVGIQMILVMTFAMLTYRFFYFNKPAALITVYVSNPVTVVPIYWLDYKVGTLFVHGNVTREQFTEILRYDGFAEWWRALTTLLIDVGWPLILGSLVIASICGALTYPAMLWIVQRYRGRPAFRPQETGSPTEARTE